MWAPPAPPPQSVGRVRARVIPRSSTSATAPAPFPPCSTSATTARWSSARQPNGGGGATRTKWGAGSTASAGTPPPILVAGRPWAPEELSARLVRWVVDRAAQREGGSAARIAVTHPASWGAHKKDRLGGALAAQGVPVTFIAEPEAAALHYAAGERVEPGS